ncbi:hypothetical protein K8T06_15995 [bacterium]|nr:hypothetical protein [bacterium]
MDIKLARDFREFLKLLNSNKISYLLIGGYAVAYHGYPRTTNDMDIWIAVTPDNIRRVISTLRQFGFDSPQLVPELFQDDKVLRMGLPPIRIKLLTSISGVRFEDCFKRRIQDNMDGVDVSLISLDDLKLNKKASGRYKDLNDLENLP